MKIYPILQRVKKMLYIMVYNFLRLTKKVNNNKILLVSNSRDDLSGNLKFIYDRMKLEQKYKINILLNNSENILVNIWFQLKVVLAAFDSKAIITDDYFPLLYALKLRKDTSFIQVWHACGAFKKVGFSRIPKNNKLRQSSLTHRNYTHVVVSSKDVVDNYAKSFKVQNEIIYPIGVPRTDMFFSKNYIDKAKEMLYNNYPILKNKRVILFAPTFRGRNKQEAYYDFKDIDIDKLYDKLKKDDIFIFKFHPFIKNKIEINEKYKDKIIDMSNLREINDLLLITDLLITDYSSVIFEYALLNKPILYYIPDYEVYKNKRNFYYDFDEYVYGKIVNSFKDLIDNMEPKMEYEEKRNKLIEKHLKMCDGKSTERFMSEIIFKLDK